MRSRNPKNRTLYTPEEKIKEACQKQVDYKMIPVLEKFEKEKKEEEDAEKRENERHQRFRDNRFNRYYNTGAPSTATQAAATEMAPPSGTTQAAATQATATEMVPPSGTTQAVATEELAPSAVATEELAPSAAEMVPPRRRASVIKPLPVEIYKKRQREKEIRELHDFSSKVSQALTATNKSAAQNEGTFNEKRVRSYGSEQNQTIRSQSNTNKRGFKNLNDENEESLREEPMLKKTRKIRGGGKLLKRTFKKYKK